MVLCKDIIQTVTDIDYYIITKLNNLVIEQF